MTYTAIAIYVRLSLEDGDLSPGKWESESITNQRDMLTDYIQNSPELCHAEVLEFCDDGYSGKNFDRPGVKRLLEAAQGGVVQCILVKDLSRFGRDYITVGNYISRVFPFLGVRFIAVNDHFDSSRPEDIDSIDTSFKALIYDLYSRDLSRKVRSAKKTLATRGVNINPVAPFGYQKDPADRHQMIPDPATADVVRRIFSMLVSGASTVDVARTLNEEGVPTPSQAKEGTSSEHANWNNHRWNGKMVSCIARNRQYMGSFVYGKTVRPQIGVHRSVKAKMEDWIIVDGCHEPLVSEELFRQTQEALGGEFQQNATYTRQDDPLKRKVYCGACGYAIVRRGTKRPYYCCQTPHTVPDAACSQEKVYRDEIMELVTAAIHVQVQYAVEAKRLLDGKSTERDVALEALRQELRSLRAEQEQITEESKSLYERLTLEGQISREDYAKEKAALLERREKIYQAEAEVKQRMEALGPGTSRLVEKYQSLEGVEELTAEHIADLLDRVTILPDRKIQIKLNYLDDILVSEEKA